MNCWIHLFSVCLFDPSNVSINADISAQVAGDFVYHVDAREYGGGLVGRIAITDAVPLTRTVTLTYGIEHQSLLNTRSDRGQERAFVGFIWRPFK